MIKKKTIIYNDFVCDEHEWTKLRDQISAMDYDDELGYGFRNVGLDEYDVLYGVFVRKVPTVVSQFDPLENSFGKNVIYIYNEIPILINKNLKVLCVVGSVTSYNFIKSILKYNIDVDCELKLINSPSYKIYAALQEKSKAVELSEISVQNFIYDNGVVGRFSGKVLKRETAIKLIDYYKEDVVKICIIVHSNNDNEITLQIASNYSMVLICEEKKLIENLFFITNLIFI